ncbi:MAG: LSU ribosomal protein L32p @ LSU ribosomal protein L32p, zinc-dependent [uncultured Thermomicrobiales bacterium]|jgi:large subunit ribosomal protein L32|uniref:Large ribosomal subunit protein bL32 n=1 Tax=uncultured Thermomicrobiales bacterium TaxID=1645740 RepID=A0A6J4U438_9BACT|nr:MAG: LSU ribosomal protein L32p @ LSU ribosomal protein L32p, zinc-dependent [uncultured Thermomicrobiales bacterium]
MGALPKQRISQAHQGTRRRHIHLTAPQLVPCASCRALKRPHHVCPNCGMYRGRQVIEIEDSRRASES